jgi:hypothetical protein
LESAQTLVMREARTQRMLFSLQPPDPPGVIGDGLNLSRDAMLSVEGLRPSA